MGNSVYRAVGVVLLGVCFAAALTIGAASQTRPDARQAVAKETGQGCADYKAERLALEALGIRDLIGRDPQEVGSTLGTEQLEHIRRLIDLDEKVLFGCRDTGELALGASVPMPPPPTRKPSPSLSQRGDRGKIPLPVRRPDP